MVRYLLPLIYFLSLFPQPQSNSSMVRQFETAEEDVELGCKGLHGNATCWLSKITFGRGDVFFDRSTPHQLKPPPLTTHDSMRYALLQ
jgi:hypothetical protein